MADIIVDSYTAPPTGSPGSLPAPDLITPGRLARVTNDVRGLWMDQGTQWVSLSGSVLNVRDFRQDGDPDDTLGIQRALNQGASRTVYLPPGEYLVTAPLTIPAYTILRGAGMDASKIVVAHNGDGLQSLFPINTTSAAHTVLSDFTIQCNNGSTTTGYGLFQRSGAFVYVDRVLIRNFEVQLVFDQTEVATVDRCVFELGASRARLGMWLVNGPDVTPMANMGSTNRIAVRDCQFNANAMAVPAGALLRDDGGIAHTFDCCNFNGYGYAGIFNGVNGLRFTGNEVEDQTEVCLLFGQTNFGGSYVGPCQAIAIAGNMFKTPSAPAPPVAVCIAIGAALGGEIRENIFYRYNAFAINLQTDAIAQLVIEGNAKSMRGSERAAGPFVGPVTGAATRLAAQTLRQKTQTFATSGAIPAGPSPDITPATMGVANTPEAITVGSRLLCMNQADGTNAEYVTVTQVGATTFRATFAQPKAAEFLILGA